jgi:hypothetical protein
VPLALWENLKGRVIFFSDLKRKRSPEIAVETASGPRPHVQILEDISAGSPPQMKVSQLELQQSQQDILITAQLTPAQPSASAQLVQMAEQLSNNLRRLGYSDIKTEAQGGGATLSFHARWRPAPPKKGAAR